jgi:hypothetical protein
MSNLRVDLELINAFENGLNPRAPEKSVVPGKVLGYLLLYWRLEVGGRGIWLTRGSQCLKVKQRRQATRPCIRSMLARFGNRLVCEWQVVRCGAPNEQSWTPGSLHCPRKVSTRIDRQSGNSTSVSTGCQTIGALCAAGDS